MKVITKLWLGLGLLALLSPLGLILPRYFKAKGPWGESESGAGSWKPLFPDYAFRGWQQKDLSHLSFAYIISAVMGIIIIALLSLLIGRMLAKKGD